jgi:hypothetical protein
MPKLLKKVWPVVLGIRCSFPSDREKYWKAYEVWKKERSSYWNNSVSDFVRACINEHIEKQVVKKEKKG